MSLAEQSRKLVAEIRSTVEEGVDSLRADLRQRIGDALDNVTITLPESLVDEDRLAEAIRPAVEAALADQPPAPAPAMDAGSLRDALTRIDAARSQADVLRALTDETSPFASRCAVFLLRGATVRGWGDRGFDVDWGEHRVDPGDGEAWHRLSTDGGSQILSSAERTDLASRLDAPVADEAVLIPLVLRDRVAAALYADRMGDDPFDAAALQTLTYVSALAIETLPLRQRDSTSTLILEAPPEPVDATPPATEAPPEVPEPVEPEPDAEASLEEPEEDQGTEFALTEEPAESLEPVETEPAVEAEAEEPAGWQTVDEEPVEEAERVVEDELVVDELVVEEEPIVDEALEPVEAAPETTTEPPPIPSGEALQSPEPEEEEPPAETLRVEAEAVEEVEDEEVETAAAEEGEEEQEAATSTTATPQVEPPDDVQGPGWAFSSTPQQEMDDEEEARHEEARRLARLLISEIKLYNEDQVQEGRKNNNVVERLKDDIDRSRQLYEERVDPRVREKTDYFYQEMVRLLGAGDPATLGI